MKNDVVFRTGQEELYICLDSPWPYMFCPRKRPGGAVCFFPDIPGRTLCSVHGKARKTNVSNPKIPGRALRPRKVRKINVPCTRKARKNNVFCTGKVRKRVVTCPGKALKIIETCHGKSRKNVSCPGISRKIYVPCTGKMTGTAICSVTEGPGREL